MEKIIATDAAENVIDALKERYGSLMFYMSGGCCEGSQPMCFEKGEFNPGSNSVLIGEIADCEFYLSPEQHRYYAHSQLVLDAQLGMGGGFSLEAILGVVFSVTSRLSKESGG